MARNEWEINRVATSVLSRIKESARANGSDAGKMIVRYALERWLHRLTLTEYAGSFILKGGMMMPLLGDDSRPTEDMDGNFEAELSPQAIDGMINMVCQKDPIEEDGLTFIPGDLKLKEIREGINPGIRASFDAILQSRPRPTPIKIKLDLTWGEAITPSSVIATLPSAVYGTEPVRIAVYPWETVLAEKIHGIQQHGILNSRMKDFYDILLIQRSTELDGKDISQAIIATFKRRLTIPQINLPGLSDEFARAKSKDWTSFTGRQTRLKLKDLKFTDVVQEIRMFAIPLLTAASEGELLHSSWIPEEGWTPQLNQSFHQS